MNQCKFNFVFILRTKYPEMIGAGCIALERMIAEFWVRVPEIPGIQTNSSTEYTNMNRYLRYSFW